MLGAGSFMNMHSPVARCVISCSIKTIAHEHAMYQTHSLLGAHAWALGDEWIVPTHFVASLMDTEVLGLGGGVFVFGFFSGGVGDSLTLFSPSGVGVLFSLSAAVSFLTLFTPTK